MTAGIGGNLRTLEGIRVVDFSLYAPGLTASSVLAGFGATVISVEPIVARMPEQAIYRSVSARRAGLHPHYRDRRSIALDLKSDDGLDIARRLIGRSDVVLEGFRPGVADRLGIGFDDAKALSPAVVYCSVTGYGQTGEQALRGGHDINYLAESGALALTGSPEAGPRAPANLLADVSAGGLMAAIRILGALVGDRSGRGAVHLDVSMTDALMAMAGPIVAMMNSGSPDPSWGRGLLTGATPYYRCYQCGDGRWVAVGAIEHQFFERLCRGLDLADYVERQADEPAWSAMAGDFARAFLSRPAEEWVRLLADAAVSPVLTLAEAASRADVHGSAEEEPRPGDAYSPEPGSDSLAVLELLGVGAEERDRLIETGAVAGV